MLVIIQRITPMTFTNGSPVLNLARSAIVQIALVTVVWSLSTVACGDWESSLQAPTEQVDQAAIPSEITVSNTGLLPEGRPLSELPLEADTWDTDINESQLPTPTVDFRDGMLIVEVAEPMSDHFPTVAIWSRNAPLVLRNQQYVMEVEARLVPATEGGNFLVGLNIDPSQEATHWFQHWHLNSQEIRDDLGNLFLPSGLYYGDWSERPVAS